MRFSETFTFRGLRRPIAGRVSGAFFWKTVKGGSPFYSHVLTRNRNARFSEGLECQAALYGKFASTQTDPGYVLGFANDYGELGLSALGGKLREVKTLDDWIAHIEWTARLLHLWTAAKDDDAPTLRQLVRWRVGGPEVEGETLRPIQAGDEDFLRPGDSAGAVRVYVTRALNGQLGSLVPVQLVLHPSPPPERLEAAPKSLWGAVCYTFALAVGSGRTHRQCVGCSRWWETYAGDRRSDRRACSAACRVKLFRGRRKKARELVAAGKTPGQVADQLGVEVDVLKGWIKAKKKEK